MVKSVFIISLLFCGAISLKDHEVVVKLVQGKVAGKWGTSYGGRPMATFFGVPYALPPIGERRFEVPELIKSWSGVWQAKKFSDICLQWYHIHNDDEASIIGSEDCLYLNIYTPNPTQDVNLPVIVYIHGGGFIFGTGKEYEGDYILDKDVVFVNINYRLGALGFMSTEDDIVPGNMGLKDQLTALKFIKQNIKYFGGDPDNITVMGMSAGGASVNFLMLSPSAKGYFNKGYSQSGTTFAPWVLQEKPLMKAKMIGKALGCQTGETKEMVDCLKQRSGLDILRTYPVFLELLYSPFSPFAPVIEKVKSKTSFITEHPHEIIKKGEIQHIPWLTSVTKDEGLFPAAIYLAYPEIVPEIESRWNELASHIFDYNFTVSSDLFTSIAEKIKDEYLGGKPLTEDNYFKFVEALGDRHFTVYSEQCARMYAKVSKEPVYFYRFNYKGAGSLGMFLSYRDKLDGVSHGDDTGYTLKTVFMDPTTTEQDRKMMKVMLNLLVSFATTGKPEFEPINWVPVDGSKEEFDFLEIYGPGKGSMSAAKDLGRTSFWKSLGLMENEHYSKSTSKDEF